MSADHTQMLTPQMLRERAGSLRQAATQAQLRAQYADGPASYRADLDHAQRLIADAVRLEQEAMRREAIGV